MNNLIRNGAGIGFLSPWFANHDPKLKCIFPTFDEMAMDMWVLIHPELRGVKRITALKDLLIVIFESGPPTSISANECFACKIVTPR